jgi:hypothetical protein
VASPYKTIDTTQFLLGRPLSIELQTENCEIVEAHVQTRTLVTSFLEIRENAEETFDGLFNRACTVANKSEITISWDVILIFINKRTYNFSLLIPEIQWKQVESIKHWLNVVRKSVV